MGTLGCIQPHGRSGQQMAGALENSQQPCTPSSGPPASRRIVEHRVGEAHGRELAERRVTTIQEVQEARANEGLSSANRGMRRRAHHEARRMRSAQFDLALRKSRSRGGWRLGRHDSASGRGKQRSPPSRTTVGLLIVVVVHGNRGSQLPLHAGSGLGSHPSIGAVRRFDAGASGLWKIM